MIKTAIYMRVSTDQQAQEGDSIPAQRTALRRYIDEHDEMTFAGEYCDDGISGTKADRDELQRLLSDVQGKKLDLILVTKLDRLYRSIRHYLNMMEILDRNGVGWLAIYEPMYDTTTPQGRLIVNQMMSIAQFEAENTSQRIKSVFEYKISQGEVVSGHQPFGYSIVNKHLVPNDDAETVRKLFDHYARYGVLGKTHRYAADLGYFALMPNLKALLQNTKYVGMFRGNEHYCPPIVSKDTFDLVQANLARNIKYNTRHIYIFSGLVKCPVCGSVMTGVRIYNYKKTKAGKVLSRNENGYICSNAAKRFNGEKCKALGKYAEKRIEKFIIENMDDIVLEYELEQEPKKDNSKQIRSVNAKLDRLKELYLNGLISLDEYKADKERFEAQLADLAQPDQGKTDLEALKQMLGTTFKSFYATMTPDEKQFLWRSIIKTIVPHRVKPLSRTIVCDVDFL